MSGKRLKFDADQPDEGVFFIATGTADEVKVTTVQKNVGTQVVFLVPPLPPGTYHLVVRARVYGVASLSEGRLRARLIVA